MNHALVARSNDYEGNEGEDGLDDGVRGSEDDNQQQQQ